MWILKELKYCLDKVNHKSSETLEQSEKRSKTLWKCKQMLFWDIRCYFTITPLSSCDIRDISCDTRIISCDTRNISCDARNISCDTRNISCDARNISCDSRNISLAPGTVKTLPLYLVVLPINRVYMSQQHGKATSGGPTWPPSWREFNEKQGKGEHQQNLCPLSLYGSWESESSCQRHLLPSPPLSKLCRGAK